MTEQLHTSSPSWEESSHQLLCVHPSTLDTVWDHLVPLLLQGRGAWEEYFTIESLYEEISKSMMQLWMMNNEDEFVLAMLTEFRIYPLKKVVNILWVGGKDIDIASDKFLDYVEFWASQIGASKVVIPGRKGWVRKLAPYGYRQTHWTIAKDVSGIKEH